MAFSFTAEQTEFRGVLRRYFEDRSPVSVVRRRMESEIGWDRAEWRSMCEELGLGGLHAPETAGGQGFGLVELALVAEEMGRALVCSPFFATTILATTALMQVGGAEQVDVMAPAWISGETTAALAFTEPNGCWDWKGLQTIATRPVGGRWRLNGVKSFVVDGASADQVLVVARLAGTRDADGVSLFLLDPALEGVDRAPLTGMDPTRRLARITLNDAPATLLGEAGRAAVGLEETLRVAAVCLANEMMGGAERLRQSALDYAQMRMQFGRPLASFQAMKHKQADMLLQVELARSAAYYAAAAQGHADFAMAAHLAKAAASEAYLQTAIHTVQIHGGIGFTWDNDTHLWFKRAKSSEVFLGDAAWHRERMLQAMGV